MRSYIATRPIRGPTTTVIWTRISHEKPRDTHNRRFHELMTLRFRPDRASAGLSLLFLVAVTTNGCYLSSEPTDPTAPSVGIRVDVMASTIGFGVLVNQPAAAARERPPPRPPRHAPLALGRLIGRPHARNDRSAHRGRGRQSVVRGPRHGVRIVGERHHRHARVALTSDVIGRVEPTRHGVYSSALGVFEATHRPQTRISRTICVPRPPRSMISCFERRAAYRRSR